MNRLPGTNIQKIVIGVSILFVFLVALSIGQYQVIYQHKKIASLSNRVLFQYSTVKEFVTRALVEGRYSDLQDTVGELEDLNASVQGILQNPLIPDQLKTTLLNRLDLAGVIILVRQIVNLAEPQKITRLQDEIRIAGEQFLQFDRLISQHVKKKLVGYQSFVIGMLLFAVLFLAHVCFFVYLRLITPLKNLQGYLLRLTEDSVLPPRELKNSGWLQDIISITKIVEQKQRNTFKKMQLLSVVFEGYPYAVIVFDEEGKVRMVNSKAKSEFKGDQKEISSSVFALLNQEAGQILREKICRLKDTKRPDSVSLIVGNREVAAALFVLPEVDGGQLFCMSWNDSVERDEAENNVPFSFRLALLGQLSCGVAHEISDSVNSLLNYQELAFDSVGGGNGAEGQKMLRAAAEEGEKIAARARLLLATSQFRMKKDNFQLVQLLNEAVGLVRNQMRSDGIRLDIDLPPVLPQVECCYGMARLICIEILLFFGELLAPFTEKRLEISAVERYTQGRGMVTLSVASQASRHLFPVRGEETAEDGSLGGEEISHWKCLRLLRDYLRSEGGDVMVATQDRSSVINVDFPATSAGHGIVEPSIDLNKTLASSFS